MREKTMMSNHRARPMHANLHTFTRKMNDNRDELRQLDYNLQLKQIVSVHGMIGSGRWIPSTLSESWEIDVLTQYFITNIKPDNCCLSQNTQTQKKNKIQFMNRGKKSDNNNNSISQKDNYPFKRKHFHCQEQ